MTITTTEALVQIAQTLVRRELGDVPACEPPVLEQAIELAAGKATLLLQAAPGQRLDAELELKRRYCLMG